MDDFKIMDILLAELFRRGFNDEEIDFFYNGYGKYHCEGEAELIRFLDENPNATKKEIKLMAEKIQNYFWGTDRDEAEGQIKSISAERGYPAELVRAAMLLVDLLKNTENVLQLFANITDGRELAIEIIDRIEKYKEHEKEFEVFSRAKDRVCEIFEQKSYDVGLLSDVKLAMEYTFHTHVPVEYDVIVKAVEIAETEGDLIKRISPIMAIVFTELQLDEEN